MEKLKNWRDLPIGGLILEPGTARGYKTGSFRSKRPIWDKKKCISCLNCWIYCPDSSIIVENGKMAGINFDYCKGCGICASVCPENISSIKMEDEKR